MLKRAKGTVLELGPGTGDQARHYNSEQIQMLYGAEPNMDLHQQLLEKTVRAGIPAQKYRIIPAGAEPQSLIQGLVDAGVLNRTSGQPLLPNEGIFDTIVAVKSLCSIDPEEMERTVHTLHRLLKPEGEFVFFEHVHSNADAVTSAMVWLTNWVWPSLMGNCHLDSKLDKVINRMDGWVPKDIRETQEYEPQHPFRYIYGRCQRDG